MKAQQIEWAPSSEQPTETPFHFPGDLFRFYGPSATQLSSADLNNGLNPSLTENGHTSGTTPARHKPASPHSDGGTAVRTGRALKTKRAQAKQNALARLTTANLTGHNIAYSPASYSSCNAFGGRKSRQHLSDSSANTPSFSGSGSNYTLSLPEYDSPASSSPGDEQPYLMSFVPDAETLEQFYEIIRAMQHTIFTYQKQDLPAGHGVKAATPSTMSLPLHNNGYDTSTKGVSGKEPGAKKERFVGLCPYCAKGFSRSYAARHHFLIFRSCEECNNGGAIKYSTCGLDIKEIHGALLLGQFQFDLSMQINSENRRLRSALKKHNKDVAKERVEIAREALRRAETSFSSSAQLFIGGTAAGPVLEGTAVNRLPQEDTIQESPYDAFLPLPFPHLDLDDPSGFMEQMLAWPRDSSEAAGGLLQDSL